MSFVTVRKWGQVDRNVNLLCVTVWVLHRAVSLQQFLSSGVLSLSLSLLERCWLDQEVRSSNNAALTEVTGHTSPYLMKHIRQIPKYRRHYMLGYAWEHFKKNFLLGFYWHPGECDWSFKLCDLFWALSESFTMSWFLQSRLRPVLLRKNVRAYKNMKYDKKRLLSHSN